MHDGSLQSRVQSDDVFASSDAVSSTSDSQSLASGVSTSSLVCTLGFWLHGCKNSMAASLKCSDAIAYGINICECMLIHLHTLIYVRGALGICHVYSTYADTHWCMLCYTQKQIVFFDMIEIVQRMRVYSIYITNAQGIRLIR